MLALQGPTALDVLAQTMDSGDVPDRFRHGDAVVAGVPALVCRTGYTGEDGVELLLDPAGAPGVWDALVAAGARPAALGARDTLRLEVCYPLYGNDLSTDRTPIEAGLKWACALDKDFIGAERLRAQAEAGTEEKLVPFAFTGPGIPRQGCRVLSGGDQVGSVTSGTLSPCLEVGIGMAYVSADLAQPGIDLIVDVRGKERPARVSTKPLYKKGD
jgi:aminomethyltransferase